MKPVISVNEARKLLGKEAENMSDEQISQLIEDLDVMAKYSLKKAREEARKKDALAFAELIYDIYKDEKYKN